MFQFLDNIRKLLALLTYTEANSQRNTDFGVHFIVFIFIKIFFMDNTFRQ